MQALRGVLAFGAGALLAAGTWRLVRAPGPRWWKENRRGRRLPVTLGWALAVGLVGLAIALVLVLLWKWTPKGLCNE